MNAQVKEGRKEYCNICQEMEKGHARCSLNLMCGSARSAPMP